MSIDSTATHCPYCSLQCGMLLVGPRDGVSVMGNPEFPVNQGGLCVKGWAAATTLMHEDRVLTPLVRDASGRLRPAGWDEALARVAERFRELQRQYGPDAVGVFGGGSLTNEKAYLLGKFARVALGTANIDYSGRFCMSSSAAAASMAFGLDRGLPFPLEDIPRAQTILMAGANVAETMPPIMRYFESQQVNGGKLIVADPRRSATAEWAALHLPLKPGSDAALANGLLHVMVRDGLVDETYIAARTRGFDDVRRAVASYWPERVERLTGVAEAALVETAHMLAKATTAMILTARGPEQQAQGVSNVLAYINLALAIGAVGKPFSGFGSLTGQGNGQGAREHGQKSDQLPGYRRIDDPLARRHVAAVWQIDEHAIPNSDKSAVELLEAPGLRALLVMGSNVVVAAPNALRVEQRLKGLDFLVVVDFFLSETAQLADVVLPSAQWAEEDGTMTNLEGRVVLRRRAFDPPEGVRTDIEVLSQLAARLGHQNAFSYRGSRDVFEELRQATSGAPADYAGMTYERIDAADGLFWPCPSTDHPGTSRLFVERFPTSDGRARFHAISHLPPAEEIDDEYPLYLTTGRVMAHYQSGTQTRRIDALDEVAPQPVAEMHPTTARLAQVSDGDRVVLSTRRGTAVFPVKVTRAIREDTVFVPFHWGGDQSVNRLTNDALDPVSGIPEFKVCALRVTADVPGSRNEASVKPESSGSESGVKVE